MKRKTILICGRENLSADAVFHEKLVDYLQSLHFDVLEELSEQPIEVRSPILVRFLKRIHIFYLLRSALFHLRMLMYRTPHRKLVENRTRNLRRTLQKMDWDQVDLYLFGRSAGAVVASRIALEFPVKAIIALGYPFFHPEYGMERYRIEHLTQIKQAMYIFQGVRDEYGTPERIQHVAMSPTIKLIPLATDHAFVLDQAGWEEFTSQLAQIVS